MKDDTTGKISKASKAKRGTDWRNCARSAMPRFTPASRLILTHTHG